CLLAAATAFRRESPAAAEALTWLFQELSPALGESQEPTVLMAVLDHPCEMLRRYVIQRLGELAEPRSAAALEARLAQENDALRPLLEIALAAARGAGPDGGAAPDAAALAGAAVAKTKELLRDPKARTALLAGSGVLLLVAFGFLLAI